MYLKKINLKKKVALVTGAGKGIGKACAIALAEAGADLIIISRTQKDLDQVSKIIKRFKSKCTSYVCDVTNYNHIKNIINRQKRIDILVNNAGITQDNLMMRMKAEQWSKVIDVNLNGVFHITRAVLKTMMKQRSGKIISISSVVGFSGNPGQVNYSSTKAALVGFTKSLAREVGSRGITVNAVAPGFIDTAMTQALNETQQEEILRQIPLKRMGMPEDIAHAVDFLASEKADYITGTVLHVNGGMY